MNTSSKERKKHANLFNNVSENEMDVLSSIAKDARKSTKQIAKETGLTRQTVGTIIKKLEDNKIILGYTPNINYGALGYKLYVLLAKLKPTFTLEDAEKGIARIDIGRKGAVVFYAGYFNGIYDLYVAFAAKNLQHATSIVNYVRKPFSDIIEEMVLEESLIDIAIGDIINPIAIQEFKKLFNK